MFYVSGIRFIRKNDIDKPYIHSVFLSNYYLGSGNEKCIAEADGLKCLDYSVYLDLTRSDLLAPFQKTQFNRAVSRLYGLAVNSMFNALNDFKIFISFHRNIPCRYDFNTGVVSDINTGIAKTHIRDNSPTSFFCSLESSCVYPLIQETLTLNGVAIPQFEMLVYYKYGNVTTINRTAKMSKYQKENALYLIFFDTNTRTPFIICWLPNNEKFLVPVVLYDRVLKNAKVPIGISDKDSLTLYVAYYKGTNLGQEPFIGKMKLSQFNKILEKDKAYYFPSCNTPNFKELVFDMNNEISLLDMNNLQRLRVGGDGLLLYNSLIRLPKVK